MRKIFQGQFNIEYGVYLLSGRYDCLSEEILLHVVALNDEEVAIALFPSEMK